MKTEIVGKTELPQVIEGTKLVAVESLVLDVYASAPPETRRRMLAVVFSKVYAAASDVNKDIMLKRLLRPLGVMSLLGIANGVFAQFRLAPKASVLSVTDPQTPTSSDLMTLVDWVQQVNSDALNAVADVISKAPELAGTSVGLVLLMMLSRCTPVRRQGEEF